MMLRCTCLTLGASLLAACFASRGQDDRAADGSPSTHVLGTGAGPESSFSLSDMRVLEYDAEVPAEADFYLAEGRFFVLRSDGPDGVLCEKSGVFAAAEEIPSDVGDCEWGNAQLGLGFTGPREESTAAGRGFLIKDRLNSTLYQVLVVEDWVTAENRLLVTLEIQSVPSPPPS